MCVYNVVVTPLSHQVVSLLKDRKQSLCSSHTHCAILMYRRARTAATSTASYFIFELWERRIV